jgi:hypothetical protein
VVKHYFPGKGSDLFVWPPPPLADYLGDSGDGNYWCNLSDAVKRMSLFVWFACDVNWWSQMAVCSIVLRSTNNNW